MARLWVAGLAAIAGLVIAADTPPAAIRMNQIGFQPESAKEAILANGGSAPAHWRLIDNAGTTVAQGDAVPFGADAASGDTVQRIDFSAVRTPGTYRIEADGADSHPFAIAPDAYASLARASLNYFYQTRAGTPIEARYAGAQWARPAGHPHEVARCYSGTDGSGTVWPGCGPYTRDVTGGWYDAGDQGKYVVNGGIAVWTLQNAYELGLAGSALDPSHNLVPNQGRLSALLVEARWEMDFLLSMQVPDGTHMQLPVGRQSWRNRMMLSDVDASGMVHHKVADENWTGLPMPPYKDPQPRLLYPPTTAATLNLAATAAQCARIWRTIDPAYADRCLSAAKRAFAAALRNPQIYTGNFTGSGGYGDDNLADEFYWATAELFATTHDPQYGDALPRIHFYTDAVHEPGWGSTAALGTITLAAVPGALPPAEQAKQRALIVAAADGFLAEEKLTGYRIPYASQYFSWGSNGTLLNRAIILALANRFTGKPAYRDAVIDVMDYILGRNPLDQSYVSGFGARPLLNPHHRYWAHELDSHLPPPPPGVLSGGPNNTGMADNVAAQMKGKCAPMRCWKDEIFAYALNEEAINWNAPLLWVAAWLDATR